MNIMIIAWFGFYWIFLPKTEDFAFSELIVPFNDINDSMPLILTENEMGKAFIIERFFS